MIRINLLGEKIDHSATYALQGILYAGSLLMSVFLLLLFQTNLDSEKSFLAEEKLSLTRRLTKLEKITKRVEDLEQKRTVLREKLNTIALLKTRKHGPVHILDDLNAALPEKAWVVDLTQKDNVLSIRGVSIDNQTIAEFMGKLNGFPFFVGDKVELVKSSEFVKDSVKLKEFYITVGLKTPGMDAKKKDETEDQKSKSSKKGAA